MTKPQVVGAVTGKHLASAPSRTGDLAPVSRLPARPGYLSNRAMVSILAQRGPEQAGQVSLNRPPADVDVGFNPMDIRNRLLEAIDQSEVSLMGLEAEMTGFDLWRRHIDYPKVEAVLSNLTAKQVKTVEQAYEDHEDRPLWEDIAGGGESHHPSDLTHDQLNRIRALLGGTQASSPDTAEEAKTHRLEAEAAELHELLFGDLDEPDVERVMTILRRSADDNVLLATTYERLYVTNFATDLVQLPLESQIRARMLVAGQSAAADAFQVNVTRYRIASLNAKIAELSTQEPYFGLSSAPGYLTDRMRKQRRELVEQLEGRLETTGAEAEAQAAAAGANPAAAAAAARNRVASVLGDVNAVAGDISGPDEAVIRAIAAADPGAAAAARLRRLDAEGKLDAAAVTAALRALRAEAEVEAARRHPGGDGAVVAIEERTLADEYFGKLKAAWDKGAVGHGPRFDELMGRGNETEARLNRALARGSGHADDVTELVLALSGDRKDLETVKRVLRDKSAADIARLKLEYKASTLGRSLDFDLFGDAPVRAGENKPDPFSYRFQMPGKATGTDRLILEDYLQRPSQEGGLEEVNYLMSRAEREYQYTIDNRGATGWWRDKWGNEARSLLDETIRQIRKWHTQYLQLVGWTWPGTLTSPERAHSPEAHELLHNIQLGRATIRGDRAAYEEATAALRATFELVASLVLQAALTAVLGPVAELAILGEVAEDAAVLMRVAAFARDASVGVASTIGANAIVYGSDYSVEMLKRDLIMGYTGTLGGKVAEKLVGPVAAGLAERLGTKCPQEIVALAGTVGSMEAAAAAEGESLTDDLNFQGVMKNHLMGKAAQGITKVTRKGLALGAAPRPETVGEPLGEGAPVPEPAKDLPEPAKDLPEPAKDLPEPAKDLPEPAKDLPEPQAGTIPEPGTPDLGEGAPASGLDEPTSTGGGGRRRARPEGRPGDRLGGRGAGRGRARRPKSPRTGRGKPGRGGGRKAKGTTSRRGGGGSPHTLGPEVTGLRTRLAEYGRRPGRSRQAKGMRSWLDDIAKRGNEEAIRDAIEGIEDMLANERMPTRSGGIEVDMGDPHIREVFEEAMAAPGLEGNREWDAYRELVYDRYTTKGSVEIGRGRSDDRGNFAKTNEMRARFLAGTRDGGVHAAAAQMMHDHLTGAVRRSGSEAGAVAAGDAVWIDRYSGKRLRGPGPNAALWPADPVWGVWRVDHIVEIQHGGLDDASNYVAAPQRMHSIKSRSMNKFGRAMRAAD